MKIVHSPCTHKELLKYLRHSGSHCVHPVLRLADHWIHDGAVRLIAVQSYVCLKCDLVIATCGAEHKDTFPFYENCRTRKRSI